MTLELTAVSTKVTVHRDWADGGGAMAKRDHIIEDISYSADPNFILCRCGSRMTGTPEELEAKWTAGHGKALKFNDVEDRFLLSESSRVDIDNQWWFWAPVIERAMECTCANPAEPSAGCPNYDEEHDSE